MDPVERVLRESHYDASLVRLLEGRPTVRAIVDAFRESLGVLGALADTVTRGVSGRRVGYIVNMILNYSNVCIVRCSFCAFHVPPGHPRAYTLDPKTAAAKVAEHYEAYGIRQVLVQGGVNPSLGLDYYKSLFREIKRVTRGRVAIHGLSPVEIEWVARKEGMRVREVLEELREAGLDSIPGGGAEILSERTRRLLSPAKGGPEAWIRVMDEAMRLGIPISATMMYGHIERLEERAEHLIRILELQRRRGRIMAFIAWRYQPAAKLAEKMPEKATGLEHLRVVAVSRLVFRHEIPWIQAGWLTAGFDVARLALHYGANDWGGTLYEEKVLPAAGVPLPRLVREKVERLIRSAGREPFERDNFYRPVAGATG